MEGRANEAHTDGQRDAGVCCVSRAVGAFLGLAAGDALGWPQEGMSKRTDSVGLLKPSKAFRAWMGQVGELDTASYERINAGEYSDDTQLMLATARSLCFGRGRRHEVLTRSELPLWTLYQRGGGGATRLATGSWLKGVPPWTDSKLRRQYFQAGGNGVAMRIIPHSVFHAGSSDSSAPVRNAVADGSTTHGHPRALIGAAALAFAAWWILRTERTIECGELFKVLQDSSSTWGSFAATSSCDESWFRAADRTSRGNYEARWQQVAEEMLELLCVGEEAVRHGRIVEDDNVLEQLGCFSWEAGSGTRTAAAAIYLCSKYAAIPAMGVQSAAFAYEADTDTIAAMTGALAGSLVGVDQLPTEWDSVQDAKYIRSIAKQVVSASGSSFSEESLVLPRRIGLRQIDEIRSQLDAESTVPIEFDGVRQVSVESTAERMTFGDVPAARILALRTTDGQLIYVKKPS